MKTSPVIAGLGEVLWDIFPDGARFGGAPANFACHAASLGAESWIASAVGADRDGEKARECLESHGVHCGTLTRDAVHPTGRVQVTLGRGGHPSYQIMPDAAWDHLPWSAPLGVLAAKADAVCFGTLGQRSPTARETIQRFLTAMPAEALKILDVNLRQDFYNAEILAASLELANAIKLNEEELPILARLFQIPGDDDASQLAHLAGTFGLRLAVLTLGARGAILFAGGLSDTYQPPAVPVVDTVGAGDSFTAAVVTGFLQDLPLADINRHASAVAGFVCSSRGATPVLPAFLRRPSPTTLTTLTTTLQPCASSSPSLLC